MFVLSESDSRQQFDIFIWFWCYESDRVACSEIIDCFSPCSCRWRFPLLRLLWDDAGRCFCWFKRVNPLFVFWFSLIFFCKSFPFLFFRLDCDLWAELSRHITQIRKTTLITRTFFNIFILWSPLLTFINWPSSFSSNHKIFHSHHTFLTLSFIKHPLPFVNTSDNAFIASIRFWSFIELHFLIHAIDIQHSTASMQKPHTFLFLLQEKI